tara:strand:- start:1316 stop:1636 length:321 start_codon:yes stop_codon:yes gene_type:complete
VIDGCLCCVRVSYFPFDVPFVDGAASFSDGFVASAYFFIYEIPSQTSKPDALSAFAVDKLSADRVGLVLSQFTQTNQHDAGGVAFPDSVADCFKYAYNSLGFCDFL